MKRRGLGILLVNVTDSKTSMAMQREGGGRLSGTLDTALEQQLGRVTAQMGASSLKTCAAGHWEARYPPGRNP